MKHNILFILLLSLSIAGNCQSNTTKESKLIDIFLSNPQPRINQTASIVINPKDIIDTLFNALSETNRVKIRMLYSDELSIGTIETSKLGKYSIGAMHFTLNQTNYRTNEINYEIVDSLPKTDKGLWIRKVNINDSIFCLIIEQRVPHERPNSNDKKISYATFEDQMQKVVLTFDENEKDLMFRTSSSSSTINTLIIDGVEKSFFYSETYNFIRIVNRNAKVILTKNNFIKIPEDYNFQNIIIQ